MKRAQQGFTLIELMIVVAIIGILAAVAIPAYQDYIQRSKVSGAVAAISSYKTGVAMCYQMSGTLTGCNAGVDDIPAAIAAGDNGATLSYVDSVAVADGVITLGTTGVDKASALMSLTLTPDVTSGAAIDWNLDGTGCNLPANANTGGRGINCDGN